MDYGLLLQNNSPRKQIVGHKTLATAMSLSLLKTNETQKYTKILLGDRS